MAFGEGQRSWPYNLFDESMLVPAIFWHHGFWQHGQIPAGQRLQQATVLATSL